MLGSGEEELWEEALEKLGPDDLAIMDPVQLRVTEVLRRIPDLRQAISFNYFNGIISDEEYDIATQFCNNLELTERPDAEVVELPVIETNDGSGQKLTSLILPKLKSRE